MTQELVENLLGLFWLQRLEVPANFFAGVAIGVDEVRQVLVDGADPQPQPLVVEHLDDQVDALEPVAVAKRLLHLRAVVSLDAERLKTSNILTTEPRLSGPKPGTTVEVSATTYGA